MSRAPIPDAESRPFWSATLEHRLVMQRCAACGDLVWYPRRRCPRCASDDLPWEELSGAGTIHAFTTVHRPADESFREDVPYVVALVDLAEGARIMTNIVGCDPASLDVGMPVEVVFRPVSDEASLPLFTPVASVPQR